MKVFKIFSVFCLFSCLNFEAYGHRALILDEIPTVNGVATRFFNVGDNLAFESVFRLPGGAQGHTYVVFSTIKYSGIGGMVGGIVDAPANVTLELHLTANAVTWSGTPVLQDAEATLYDGDLQDDTETDVFIKI